MIWMRNINLKQLYTLRNLIQIAVYQETMDKIARFSFLILKTSLNKTIANDSSIIRLENSQEIKHCFGTLTQENQKRRESRQNDNVSRNEIDLLTLKKNSKGLTKTRKYLNERAQNVASIYKKSSLSIAHFLSNYALNPKQAKLIKKRK